MKCYHCGSEVIWQNDYSYEDEGMYDEEGIISLFLCTHEECQAITKVYLKGE